MREVQSKEPGVALTLFFSLVLFGAAVSRMTGRRSRKRKVSEVFNKAQMFEIASAI
jgi:hypothetical protein